MNSVAKKISFKDTLMGDTAHITQDPSDGFLDLFNRAKYIDQPEMIDIPMIRINKEEHIRLCKPWRKGLLINLLGKNLPRKTFECQVGRL